MYLNNKQKEEEIKKVYKTDVLFENSQSRTGHLVTMTEQEMCSCSLQGVTTQRKASSAPVCLCWAGIPASLQTGKGTFQGVAAPQRREPASPEAGAVNAIQCSGNGREITLP